MDSKRMELFAALGYRPPAASRRGRAVGPSGAVVLEGVSGEVVDAEAPELPPLEPEELEALRTRFLSEPDEVLHLARESLGAPVSELDFARVLQEVEQALRAPEEALQALRHPPFRAKASVQLPPDFRFPLMTHEIPIDPTRTKFEPVADLRGWLLFMGKAWLRGASVSAAPFRRHDDARHASRFRYALREPAPGRPVEVALFSDFGTGEYPARYVARQLLMRGERLEYAVHLGGVYYAGRQGEFDAHVAEPLESLLPVTTVLTLNASPEMRSGGSPYFRYLDERRGAARARQVQEGSYFCLASERFQLIGLDTAYFEPGRHREPALLGWLESVLTEGRRRGALNLVMSHGAPYRYGAPRTTELLEDLKALVVERALADLWLWGSTPHGALFDRGAGLPFLGVSLGHGGLPVRRAEPGAVAPAPVRFLESRPRFPEWTGVRPELGNNGYSSLLLHDDGTVGLEFLDWMGNVRCAATLAREGSGPLVIQRCNESSKE
ncbi:hypothetical protein HPC49_24455 [Pyxidicoccus fallax]|uniref:Calcineurin-like phosphoesterase domain-containing protein n=1 Tax=Pyxidicoccus fallax TaxID=394095 RepID=A0A848LS70_9BACT|nr:hypothetical protein [Pyxidicoccus fallax]NMO20470.1 hypothetical protein [Pyxidicoccus fallax]NPC81369.1 hypothetical protein [Pyxidicoccus fallax]